MLASEVLCHGWRNTPFILNRKNSRDTFGRETCLLMTTYVRLSSSADPSVGSSRSCFNKRGLRRVIALVEATLTCRSCPDCTPAGSV